MRTHSALNKFTKWKVSINSNEFKKENFQLLRAGSMSVRDTKTKNDTTMVRTLKDSFGNSIEYVTYRQEGAVAFRQNQTKNIGGVDFSVPPFIFFRVFNKMMLNFSEILRFDYIFLFYPRFLAQRTFVRFSLVSQGFLL